MSDFKNPELLKRITVKPEIMLGKEQLHDDYPFLEAEDLSACLLYASQLVENERVFAVTA